VKSGSTFSELGERLYNSYIIRNIELVCGHGKERIGVELEKGKGFISNPFILSR
jgi:hypothetical protein